MVFVMIIHAGVIMLLVIVLSNIMSVVIMVFVMLIHTGVIMLLVIVFSSIMSVVIMVFVMLIHTGVIMIIISLFMHVMSVVIFMVMSQLVRVQPAFVMHGFQHGDGHVHRTVNRCSGGGQHGADTEGYIFMYVEAGGVGAMA